MSRCTRIPGKAGARGFSLLEAIVALTVFSICAMALYAWLAVNISSLARVQARANAVSDGRTALAVLEPVNPMLEPTGERRLPGGMDIRWTSEPVVDPKPGYGPGGNPLIFDLGLYDMDVRVTRNGRESNRFVLRRAGWNTVRTLRND